MKTKKISQTQAHKEGTEYQFIEQIEMGPWTSYSLLHDPVHMSFVLSRYKFVARMLAGKKRVLEVGCGDAPGTPMVAQFTGSVLGIDFEPRVIASDKKRLAGVKNVEFRVHNICEAPPGGTFDACYSIDVIEHLDKHLNRPFLLNQVKSLTKDGICIIGTPNITARKYATPQSASQHINLQSQKSLRAKLEKYFSNVFMFGQNDDVVHTGYGPMCHYIWGMGVGLK